MQGGKFFYNFASLTLLVILPSLVVQFFGYCSLRLPHNFSLWLQLKAEVVGLRGHSALLFILAELH